MSGLSRIALIAELVFIGILLWSSHHNFRLGDRVGGGLTLLMAVNFLYPIMRRFYRQRRDLDNTVGAAESDRVS